MQISDEHPILAVIGQGVLPAMANILSSTSATYAQPVLTAEPPMVFIKPRAAFIGSILIHRGAPGNWTGFTIDNSSRGVGGSIPGLGSLGAADYFIAHFDAAKPRIGYGLFVQDGVAKACYSSNDIPVKLLGGSVSGGWGGSTGFSTTTGYYYAGYRHAWIGGSDSYILANSIWGGTHNTGVSFPFMSSGFKQGDRSFVYAYADASDSALGGPPINGRTFFAAVI